jgi:hypothetical protein
MISKTIRLIRHRAVAAVLLALGAIVVVQAPAQAAGPGLERADAANPHCVTRVQRSAPDNPEVQVVGRSCAPSTEEAREELYGAATTSDLRAEGIPLVTVYEHADWKGLSDTVEGDYGECDSEGYYIPSLIVNYNVNGMSSYRHYSRCNGAKLYYWANDTVPCMEGTGDARWIGAACDNHVYGMQMFRRY